MLLRASKKAGYLRGSVTHGRDDLACLPELRSKLDVDGVRGKVDNGAVSTDVKDRVVVVHADL